MAELFKAQLIGNLGFEKLVAIKKILPHLATDRSFVEMFIDEARITAQLDHSHIVQVFELGTDADTPYIAMQFVDGLDVLALLRECARAQIRLPAEFAALNPHAMSLDALDYAHHAVDVNGTPLGIVHRDISPGNVLLHIVARRRQAHRFRHRARRGAPPQDRNRDGNSRASTATCRPSRYRAATSTCAA